MYVCWEEAVKRGDGDVVRDLISRGIDLDARDRHGQTGLMLAARAGRLDVVQQLIEGGANLNVTAKYGLSALMLAVIAGHEDVARALIDAGADVTLRGTGAPGFAGKTAADLAVSRGWRDLAEDKPDRESRGG